MMKFFLCKGLRCKRDFFSFFNLACAFLENEGAGKLVGILSAAATLSNQEKPDNSIKMQVRGDSEQRGTAIVFF